jgi:hypothetical protein
MAGASRCPAQRVAQRIFQGEAPGEIQMARAIERERDCHISNDRARAFWCASTQVFCVLSACMMCCVCAYAYT